MDERAGRRISVREPIVVIEYKRATAREMSPWKKSAGTCARKVMEKNLHVRKGKEKRHTMAMEEKEEKGAGR